MHSFFLIISLSLALTIAPNKAHAQPNNLPYFTFPLACTLDKDCWVAKYVDTDPAPDAYTDFKCSSHTEDNHRGTDIAIRSRAEMETGVAVLAAHDGTVLRLRDGQSDADKTDAEIEAIKEAKTECGNGIIIDHGDNLQTMYCHLKSNSLSVAQGDTVSAGQPIAELGHSGLSKFPHLHFSITSKGKQIDPFTGQFAEAGCGKNSFSIWKDSRTKPKYKYQDFTLFDAGFYNAAPDFKALQNGKLSPKTLPQNSPALVYWIGFYNEHASDRLTLTIFDPNGQIFKQQIITPLKNRTRAYYYLGRKTTHVKLIKGTYKATASFERKDGTTRSYSHEIKIY